MSRQYELPESINPERAAFLAEQVDTTLDAAHEAFDMLAEQVSPALQAHRYEVLVTDDAPGAVLTALVVRGLSMRLSDSTRTVMPRLHRLGQPDPGGLMERNNLLLVTSVIQDQDSLDKCRPVWEDGRKMDVAGLQTFWPLDHYYREWAQWLPTNTSIYSGLSGTEKGVLLGRPTVILTPEPQLPYQDAILGEITVPEHQLLASVAGAHVHELTGHLYARHFPRYSSPLPPTIRCFTFGTEGTDATTTA